MAGETIDSSIDQNQARIDKRKLSEQGAEYGHAFFNAVDNFQAEYAGKFKTDEGKEKFTQGKEKVNQILMEAANRGAELVDPKNKDQLARYRSSLAETISKYRADLRPIREVEEENDTAEKALAEINPFNLAQEILALQTSENGGKLSEASGKCSSTIDKFAALIRNLEKNKDIPEGLKNRLIAASKEKIIKIGSYKSAVEKALVAQKYLNYLDFKLTIEPNFALDVDFKKGLMRLPEGVTQADVDAMNPKERKQYLKGGSIFVSEAVFQNIIMELGLAGNTGIEAIEHATAPAIMDNYYAAKEAFEAGMLPEAVQLMRTFLDVDIKSVAFLSSEVADRAEEYQKNGEFLLSSIEADSEFNKEYAEAEKVLQGGDIYRAKILFKNYVKKATEAEPQDQGKFTKLAEAKNQLIRIALIQVAQVRGRMEQFKPEATVMVPDTSAPIGPNGMYPLKKADNPEFLKYRKYEDIVIGIEAKINAGQADDFNQELDRLGAEEKKIIEDPSNKFNFIRIEVAENAAAIESEKNPEKRRAMWLELARKFRESGQTGLAEEYFNKYFAGMLSKTAKEEMTVEKVIDKYRGKPDFVNIVNGQLAQVRAEWEKLAAEKGEEFTKQYPWNPALIRKALERKNAENILPREVQRYKQTQFNLKPELLSQLSPDDQKAWGEFMDMKGFSEVGTNLEPFDLSDDQWVALKHELPKQIIVITLASLVAGAAGGAVARGLMAGRAVMVGNEIMYASVGAQALSGLGGFAVESLAFTASSSAMNMIITPGYNPANIGEELASGTAALGGLKLFGRFAQAMKFAQGMRGARGVVARGAEGLMSIGGEVVAMANIDMATNALLRGEYVPPNMIHTLAMVAGLKLGHLPGQIKLPKRVKPKFTSAGEEISPRSIRVRPQDKVRSPEATEQGTVFTPELGYARTEMDGKAAGKDSGKTSRPKFDGGESGTLREGEAPPQPKKAAAEGRDPYKVTPAEFAQMMMEKHMIEGKELNVAERSALVLEIKKGRIDADVVESLINTGTLQIDKFLVDVILERSLGVDVNPFLELLLKLKPPLDAGQQIILFDSITKAKILKFEKFGEVFPMLDKNIPEIMVRLLENPHTYKYLLKLIEAGEFKINDIFVELMLKSRDGVKILEGYANRNLIPKKVYDRFEAQLARELKLIKETDEALGGVSPENINEFRVKIADYFASGKFEGKLGQALERLAQRDPEGAEILRENIATMPLDIIRAVIEGRKSERIDEQNRKIIVYEGVQLGIGGFGIVTKVAFYEPGTNKLQYGAMKVMRSGFNEAFLDQNPWYRENFNRERQTQDRINDSSVDYFNKMMRRGKDFVIMETGSRQAMSLSDAIKSNSLTPCEAMGHLYRLCAGIRWLRTGAKKGEDGNPEPMIHGDIKPGNYVIFVGDAPDMASGKDYHAGMSSRGVIIDNAWTGLSELAGKILSAPYTPEYSIGGEAGTAIAARYSEGHVSEMLPARDNKAIAVIANELLDNIQQYISPSQYDRLLTAVRRLDPQLRETEPGKFEEGMRDDYSRDLDEFMSVLDQMMPTLSRTRTNYTKIITYQQSNVPVGSEAPTAANAPVHDTVPGGFQPSADQSGMISDSQVVMLPSVSAGADVEGAQAAH
jgi:hypothetical protein